MTTAGKIKPDIGLVDRLMAEAGIGITELASQLGVARSTVMRWLGGETPIPRKWIIPIAKALGVDSRTVFPD